MYTYVDLVLKESTTYILYKSPHICEELVYMLKYYKWRVLTKDRERED